MSAANCPGANTAVMVVHGIGTQDRGETQAAYGGAIERLWDEFGINAADHHSFGCPDGHIHLVNEDGLSEAMIGEGYWDDETTEAPSSRELLKWLLLSGPPMVLYTFTRLPRWSGGLWQRYRALFNWILRAMLSLAVVGIVQITILVTVTIGALASKSRVLRKTVRVAALTIGDTYSFGSDWNACDRLVSSVTASAARLSDKADQMVVVAHSQGGAVTFEAMQRPDWPDIPTSVITLGSGHKRLTLLRRFTATPLRRFMTGSFSVFMSILGLGGIALTLEALSTEDADLSTENLTSLLLVAMFYGGIILFLNRRTGHWIGKRIKEHTVSWLDIWATHDLVPDGPVAASGTRTLQVHNGQSVVIDHTTYHRNAPEVLTTIVDEIDPSRLEGDQPVIDELRKRRQERLRGSKWLTILGITQYRQRIKEEPIEIIDAEFAGQIAQV